MPKSFTFPTKRAGLPVGTFQESGRNVRDGHGEESRPLRYFVFFREDGLAWKPYGLSRFLWSRRPWDFHAIAPLKGCSKGN